MMIILTLWDESFLSLPLSKVFKPMAGHPVNKDILWAHHTCNTLTFIRGRALSIWGLYPDMITHVVSNLQLFRFIQRNFISTFQSDSAVMNQVGKSSQCQYIILWSNMVSMGCFHYGALFLCCNLFHTPMTLFHNAITEGNMHTTKMQSTPPIQLENSWSACCEMLCHYQRVFQLACCARSIGLLIGWWYFLHPDVSNDAKWKTV